MHKSFSKVIISFGLLMICLSLWAQENEQPGWGDYWLGWPVKPGEVFADAESYWFYDNVDFSDSIEYTIHFTTAEDFERTFIFVAWGFWEDPYRLSRGANYSVFDTYEHDETHVICDPDEHGKGFLYVVEYQTANGGFYHEINNSETCVIIKDRLAIEMSERITLSNVKSSNQDWYDIDIEDVSFSPNQFLYDATTHQCQPEYVHVTIKNDGEINIQRVKIHIEYQNDGIPDDEALRDSVSYPDMGENDEVTAMLGPIYLPRDFSTEHLFGQLTVSLFPYWKIPFPHDPIIEDRQYCVPPEHLFKFYGENPRNNESSMYLEWNSGNVHFNKDIVLNEISPVFGDSLTGLDLSGLLPPNLPKYLPANQYVTAKFRLVNDSDQPLQDLEYRFEVVKRKFFEPAGPTQWAPIESGDHYYCSPSVNNPSSWRTIAYVGPGRQVDLELDMQKFRNIDTYGEDYRRNPEYDPSNWRIMMYYRWEDDEGTMQTDETGWREIYFLEDEKLSYYGFPLTRPVLDYTLSSNQNLWDNSNVVVNSTLDEMRVDWGYYDTHAKTDFIDTSYLRFHQGIDLLSNVVVGQNHCVFTISSGKLKYVRGNNVRNSHVITKSHDGDYQRFCYFHSGDVTAVPHSSFLDNRLVNSGVPISMVTSSGENHTEYRWGWSHLHFNDYDNHTGDQNPLRRYGMGLYSQKAVDGMPPIIYSTRLFEDRTRDEALQMVRNNGFSPLASSTVRDSQIVNMENVETAGLDVYCDVGDQIGVPPGGSGSNGGLKGVYRIGYKLERLGVHAATLVDEIGPGKAHWQFDESYGRNAAQSFFSAFCRWEIVANGRHVFDCVLTNRIGGESYIPKYLFINGAHRITVQAEDIEGNIATDVIDFEVVNGGMIPDPVITTSETWSGVVHIPYDVTVTSSGSLTIQGGTTIIMYNDTQLILNGAVTTTDNGDQINFSTLSQHNNAKMQITSAAPSVWRYVTFKNLHVDSGDRTTTAALTITNSDNISFENCRFVNCSSDLGGAIYCDNSDISVINCEFIGNQANLGGALYLNNSNPTMIGNFYWNNRATQGAVIYSSSSNPLCVNETYRQTLDASEESAFHLEDSNPDFYNSIFYNEPDGEIDCNVYLGESSQPDFWNCAVFNGQSTFEGNLFTGAYNSIIEIDPQFVSQYQVGYVIERNSPCVNAGLYPVPNVSLPLADIANNPRVDVSYIDIGAYESPQTSGNMHVTGDILEDTFWGCDVVYIDGNVNVIEGVTLTVLPDVDIALSDGCNLTVNGSINLLGTENEPVIFTCTDDNTTGSVLNITGQLNSLQRVRTRRYIDKRETGDRDGESSTTFSYCEFNPNSTGLVDHGIKIVISDPEQVVFEHCSFDNPDTEINGGIVEITGSSPIFRDCTFEGGDASKGGAIYAVDSDFQLLGCVLHDNYASEGGAIYLDSFSSPLVSNCTIVDNEAISGGGIYCNGSTATPVVVNSILYDNQATEGDQGYFYDYGEVGYGVDVETTGFYYSDIQQGEDGLFVYTPELSRSSSNAFANSPTRTNRDGVYLGAFESIIDCDPSLVPGSFELENTSLCINRGTLDNWSVELIPEINCGLIGYPPTDDYYDMGAKEKTHYGSITIGGEITDDCYLFADTIFVTTNLTIPQEVEVVVDSLVKHVQFSEDVSVQVAGLFRVSGAKTDPVHLNVVDGANDWAGIHLASGGAIELSNAVVTNCYGVNGGVVASAPEASITISNCEFFNNEATLGGCFYLEGGEIWLSESVFRDNSSEDGGAIYHVTSDTLDISGCVFHDNTVETTGNGGAIYTCSSVKMTDNLFYANTSINGGAIYHADGDLICLNATICDNTASLSGGGIEWDRNAECLRFAIVNSIIRDNTDSQGDPSQFSRIGDNSIQIAYCNVQNMMQELYDNQDFHGVATALFDVDPGFVSTGTGDYGLNLYSPMIDAGAPTPHYLAPFDFSLSANDFGHACSGMGFDIGSREYPEPPGCEISPGGLDFGAVYIGDSQTQYLTIRNRGTTPLVRIEDIAAPSTQYSISLLSGEAQSSGVHRKRNSDNNPYLRCSTDLAMVGKPVFVGSASLVERSGHSTTSQPVFPIDLAPFDEVTFQIEFTPISVGVCIDPLQIQFDSESYGSVELPLYASGLDDTQYIDRDTYWSGIVDVETHYMVNPGVTLTIADESTLHFCNNRKIQFNHASLSVGEDVCFVGDDTQSLPGLYFSSSEDVEIGQAAFTNVRLMAENTNVTAEGCHFSDSYLEQINGNLEVASCTLDSTHINAYMNMETDPSTYVTIEDCEMTFSPFTNLVSISSYPNFSICNNTMENYQTALWINESGSGKTHQIVDNSIFNNQYGYGIELYHTIATIGERNQVYNNYIGIAAVRNSVVDIIGSRYHPYQSIHNNYNAELVFSEDSMPIFMYYNLIYDDIHPLDHYVRCVHHGGETEYLVRDNYWGTGFEPEDHLYPYGWLYCDPQWTPGDSVTVGYNPAQELLAAAVYNMDLTNYSLAVTQLEQVIDDYPGSPEAKRAAQLLLSMYLNSEQSLTELQQYYSTEPNMHYNDEIDELAEYLITVCDIKMGDYVSAIAWFEDIIDDPPSEIDSLYAQIDLAYTYLMMEAPERVNVGRYPQYCPDSRDSFMNTREEIISRIVLTQSDSTPPPPEYAFEMQQNFPNPFNPETTINFALPQDMQVELAVYNVRGQRVRTLTNAELERGKHSIIWDGRDGNQQSVASGVYFYRLKAGQRVITKKMLLMK